VAGSRQDESLRWHEEGLWQRLRIDRAAFLKRAALGVGGTLFAAELLAGYQPASAQASGSDVSPFNVKDAHPPYSDVGAAGDGTTDDTAAIQATIDACGATGGGAVYLPACTYLVDVQPSGAALDVPYTNIAVTGDGMGSTTIRLKAGATQTPASDYLVKAQGNTTSSHWFAMADLTIDGNGSNQSGHVFSGLGLFYLANAHVRNVCAQNFPGNSGTESAHFSPNYCYGVVFDGCVAVCNQDVSASGSGFSSSGSFMCTFIGCRADGMGFCGFTSYHDHLQTFVSCIAQRNTQAGFNNEHAEDNLYVNCIAGGRTPNYLYDNLLDPHVLPDYPVTTTYPYGDSPLGNGDGFRASLSSARVTFANCHSLNNEFGLKVEGGSTDTVADGGTYAYNDIGLSVEGGATGTLVAAGAYVHNTCGMRFDSQAASRASKVGRDVTLAANGHDVFLGGGLHNVDSSKITAPAVPRSKVAVYNDYPWPVDIYVIGTVTRVNVNSRNLGPQKFFRVEPGTSFSINYSKAPTWVWRRS